MRIQRRTAAASLCLTLCLVMAPSILASDQSKPGSRQPISVVAHINLPGSPATQMHLQQENGREYLYLVRSSGTGFTIVDVTKPEKVAVIKKVTLPSGTSDQGLDLIGNSMAMAEESNGSTSSSSVRPESIQFFDTADPANPRVVKTFTDVTSVLTEDGRHLVYLTNNQGLWILRRPTRATTHPCTSSDEISALPDCD